MLACVAEFVMAFSLMELAFLGAVGLMAQTERPTRWLFRLLGLRMEDG